MPGQVLPNEGLPDLLDYMIRATISGVLDWELMLFVNDIVPDQDTVYADLVEASLTGYSRVTLSRGTWTSPVIVSNRAVSTYGTTPISWSITGGSETVYGHALVTPSSPVIRFVERWTTPVAVSPPGVLAVLPRITQTTEVLS